MAGRHSAFLLWHRTPDRCQVIDERRVGCTGDLRIYKSSGSRPGQMRTLRFADCARNSARTARGVLTESTWMAALRPLTSVTSSGSRGPERCKVWDIRAEALPVAFHRKRSSKDLEQ